MVKPRLPLAGSRGIGNRFQFKPSSIFAPDQNGECIVEPRGGRASTQKLLRIFAFNLIVNRPGIGDRLMMQYRRKSGAGVFGIKIDLAGHQSSVSKISSETEFAIHLTFLSSNICATIRPGEWIP